MSRGALLLVALGLGTALVACSSSTGTAVDAGVPLVLGERGEVIDMPTGFADVATTCHEGNRIFVGEVTGGGYSGSHVAVVAADPTCQA